MPGTGLLTPTGAAGGSDGGESVALPLAVTVIGWSMETSVVPAAFTMRAEITAPPGRAPPIIALQTPASSGLSSSSAGVCATPSTSSTRKLPGGMHWPWSRSSPPTVVSRGKEIENTSA